MIVAGSLAQRPGVGGHTWVLLQYLLGFRELGWRPIFVDRLEPAMCTDTHGRPCPPATSENLAYLREVMRRFGLEDSFSVLLPEGEALGLSRAQLLEAFRQAPLLVNIMGFLDDEELLEAAPRRVFVDIDPGFPQMWRDLGLHDAFAGHDVFFTVGLGINDPHCAIPACGLEWHPTVPPIALSEWPVAGPGERFTSVATWRGLFEPIEHGGVTYGLRVHEFRRLMTLPEVTGESFEIALAIDPADSVDRESLVAHGWKLLDPRQVAGDPWTYRDYVSGSLAELNIAKNLYVATGSGWFSDRSACYLASGKPVVAQDTGFSRHLPTGEGLLTFTAPADAAAAIDEVKTNPAAHARAARAIAEDHFDARDVLARLIDKAVAS